MVSAGMKVIKYLLFIFNFIFWVTGVGILALGIYMQVKFSHYFNFVGSQYLSAPILLIVVGSIISVIAFFGCCGACKENHCMTITFSVLLGIIFILELAAGIAAYVMSGDLENIIQKNMSKGLEHYNQTDYGGMTATWNAIQHDFKCCGVNNSEDWMTSSIRRIPKSCCIEESDDCNTSDKTQIYKDGCFKKFKTQAEKNIITVGGVGVGIAFIQIIGIVCACCLASAIKREYEVV